MSDEERSEDAPYRSGSRTIWSAAAATMAADGSFLLGEHGSSAIAA